MDFSNQHFHAIRQSLCDKYFNHFKKTFKMVKLRVRSYFHLQDMHGFGLANSTWTNYRNDKKTI